MAPVSHFTARANEWGRALTSLSLYEVWCHTDFDMDIEEKDRERELGKNISMLCTHTHNMNLFFVLHCGRSRSMTSFDLVGPPQ